MKRESIRLRPTGLWILFGPVMVCMWFAAVNYSNNLVYAILYLVGALTFISLFHAWRNVAAAQVRHVRAKASFAGEETEVEIFLGNTGRDFVSNLVFLYVDGQGDTRPLTTRDRATRLRPGDSVTLVGTIPTQQRGLYRLDSLIVRSAAPFGLAWAAFRVPLDLNYFVYPRPGGSEEWPEFQAAGEGGSPATNRNGDDFAGVKSYSPGDSLRHVDWKAYARGRALMIKQFSGGDRRELWLDAGQLAGWPLEERLSQLTLWAVQAEQEEIPYGLSLGRVLLPIGLGPVHLRQVLEALAVDGGPVAELDS